jgi:subtilase family serine protease
MTEATSARSRSTGLRRSRQVIPIGMGVLIALGVTAGPALATTASTSAAGDPPPTVTSNCLTATPRQCYTVDEYRAAYGVQPLLDRGLTGRGQTVVLPEYAVSPDDSDAADIRENLAIFDHTFGLPDTRLEVVNSIANSQTPELANHEEILDIELVHQIAPEAAIKVVLFSTATEDAAVDGLIRSVRLAPSLGGSIVSISLAASEPCFTPTQVAAFHAALRFDRVRHTTVITGSGDDGAATQSCDANNPPAKGVALPASDPNSLAVGGTTLQAAHPKGAYIGETVWNEPMSDENPPLGSGGGFSALFATPHYQRGVPAIGAHRGVPDVAASANITVGPVVALTFNHKTRFVVGGGTSAAAPFWAGLVALANQKAHKPLGFINPTIYHIAQSPLYRAAFHDITMGNNSVDYPSGSVTGYNATPGWDPATGWGSPNASVLVPLLAAVTNH